jgi:NAD(P)-dependent dehydrogenase (short-subunit alcohol dehydrogenase family)
MPDGPGELQLLNLARKQSRNHMATKVCFINRATRGIGAQIAKGRLSEGNQFAAIDRKSGPGTPRPSDNLQPVAPELARRGQVEMAALLPSIAVVFTVAGPVVYETRTPSVRVNDETND